MTNAALLLQSLSLSLDTAAQVLDRNDGRSVSWADGVLTATTPEDEDGDQVEVSFPVTTADLAELHKILTAHLAGVTYHDQELTTDGGYLCLGGELREYGNGLCVEAGTHDGAAVSFDLGGTDVALWHQRLTITLLSAALAA